MKNILQLVLATLLASRCFGGTTTTFNDPPDSLPIGSVMSLATAAIQSVTNGGMGISGDALLVDGKTRTFVNATGDMDSVLASLSNQGFSFKVFDTTKPVSEWLYLSDENGNPLFWGYGFGNLVAVGPVYQPDPNSPLTVRPNWDIGFHIPNLSSAVIQYEDGEGNYWTEQLDVFNSTAYIPFSYAGKYNKSGGLRNGVVILYFTSNGETKSYAYSLQTEKMLPSYNVSGTPQIRVQNYNRVTVSGQAQVISATVYDCVVPANSGGNVVMPPHITLQTYQQYNTVVAQAVINGDIGSDVSKIKCYYSDPSKVDASGNAIMNKATATNLVRIPTTGTAATSTLTSQIVNLPAGHWSITWEIPVYEEQQPPSPPYYGDQAHG